MKSSRWTRDGLMRRRERGPSYGALAFFLPFLILAIGYATRLVFPFGDRHILTVDLYHQYAPFLAELREKLLTFDSLFYSFRGGLGVNFYALFAYYLASPLNLLLLVFPPAFLAEGILMLTLIKVGLAGLTFNLMLRRAYLRSGPLAVGFSTMYALSAYTMAYGWNVMWLDALYTLPLVILGLVLLIRERRFLLYPLAIAYLLLVNYYMAMFALIFTFFYYPVLLFRFTADGQPRRRLISTLLTLFYTLIGVGLSAILTWPTYLALKMTSAAGDSFPKTVESTFNLIDFFGQHLMLVEPTVRDGMPNMYAGTLILLLLPIYFLASRVRLRDRLLNLTMLAFLIVSFNTNVLNFLWHGTHFPNQLPYRNAFVYIFFLLFMLYDALPQVKTFSSRELGAIGIAAALLTMLVAPSTSLRFTPFTVYATLFFLVLYVIVLSRFRLARKQAKPVAFMLLSLIFFEMVLHTGVSLYYLDKNEYFGRRDGYAYGMTAEAIRKAQTTLVETTNDTLFFRSEVFPDKTSNDPFLYGFDGLTLFASTSPKQNVRFFRNVGFPSNGINSYKYQGSTLPLDALLGIRYLSFRETPRWDEQLRELVLKNEEAGVFVYENDQALSVGNFVQAAVLDFVSDDLSPFGNQNRLFTAMTGDSLPLLDSLPLVVESESKGTLAASGSQGLYHFEKNQAEEKATFTLSFDTSQSGTYYLAVDMRGHKVEDLDLTMGQQNYKVGARRGGMSELGYLASGSQAKIQITLEAEAATSGEMELYVARLNETATFERIHRLREGALIVRERKSDSLSGTLQAPEDGVILLSIPYDPGWKATLNGQPAEIETVDECLMAIPVTQGEQELVLRFQPPGFLVGLLVSAGSVVLLLISLLAGLRILPRLGRWRREERERRLQTKNFVQSLERETAQEEEVDE